jgi:thiol-disulfide isomerase/thioredoxin
MLKLLVAGGIIYYMMNMPPSLDLTKPSFTLYYASWCPHCEKMLPDWEALGNNVNGVVIRKLEQKQNTEYEVKGYPTIIYRDGKGGGEKYDGIRSKQDIMAYLSSKAQ